MIPEFLPKQSEMVIQTNTVPRQPQGSNGIQKTGSQTAQSAVSERRLRLLFLNLADILSCRCQDLPDLIIPAQINQVV